MKANKQPKTCLISSITNSENNHGGNDGGEILCHWGIYPWTLYWANDGSAMSNPNEPRAPVDWKQLIRDTHPMWLERFSEILVEASKDGASLQKVKGTVILHLMVRDAQEFGEY